MTIFSVQQSLVHAKSFEKKGDFESARALYKSILKKFPGNKAAIDALAALDKIGSTQGTSSDPLRGPVDHLILLFRLGRLVEVVNLSQQILIKFPRAADVWNILGVASQSLGNISMALNAFKKSIEINPSFSDSYSNLGVVLLTIGEIDAAMQACKRAIDLKPDYAEAHYNLGNVLRQKGDHDTAVLSYKKTLKINPNHNNARNNLGNILKDQGNLLQAKEAFLFVVSRDPNHVDAFNNLGAIQKELGDLDGAMDSYKRALALRPDHSGALNNFGVVLQEQGKLEAALVEYHRALEVNPGDPEVYNNIGHVFIKQEKLDQAIEYFEKSLVVDPKNVDAYCGLGNALKGLRKDKDAAHAYGCALEINPEHVDAHLAYGLLFRKQGKYFAALGAFHRALTVEPDSLTANNALGVTLMDVSQYKEAEVAFNRALKIKPDSSETLGNLAGAMLEQKRRDEAIRTYERALELAPKDASLEATILNQKMQICDWSGFSKISEACRRLGVDTGGVAPFGMIALEDNPARQLARAKIWATERFKEIAIPFSNLNNGSNRRLRIGYFGGDFNDHPCMYLISGLLREHDKKNFEIFVFSYGRVKTGELRKQTESDVEHFIDVSEEPNLAVVELARKFEIDVAIDLNAYSGSSRSVLFQHRLAPVQISFLGYPGTMGCDFMDYIVSDSTVIADDTRCFYTENVIFLPHTFLPNDNTRLISSKDTTRQDFGLPADDLVLCSFNNNYKITPREFDIWMRIMNKFEGSVLWLGSSNKWSQENLKREAVARGIASERLIFADKVPMEEHLARHKHADLFMDSFIYNAHSTACDALWGGLPIVTMKGAQFSARVAASCLNSIGLSELVTTSEDEYEQLIVDLVSDKDRLRGLKERVAKNRLSSPLFDTVRYARNLERGFRAAHEAYRSGRRAEDIWVREGGEA